MKCDEVETRMIDYLDNTLEDGIRQEIDKHLVTCEICLDELRESQKILRHLSMNEMVKPDNSLRINFYHMLHSQIKKSEGPGTVSFRKPLTRWHSRSIYRIAAGIALLICGTVIGMIIQGKLANSYALNELKKMQSQVSSVKESAMFTMLKDESSSDRIKAVSYAEDLDNPDGNVIEVLINTLNYDKNLNVRMAAAYALAKFTDQRAVCDSLVSSLSLQREPLLQITLINILAERREKSALKPIQEIIANKRTLKEVRSVAQNSLRLLI